VLTPIAIGLLLYPPVRLAGLVLLGRSPHCPLRQAVQSSDHARRLRLTEERMKSACKLVGKDAAGFNQWDTPLGRFWIPAGSDSALRLNVAEQLNLIYGVGEQAVKSGDIVLDCGANVGVYTRVALQAGAKRVVAIEPAPENLECLRRGFSDEISAGRVVLYEKGVWDKEDMLTLFVDPHNSAGDSFVIHLKSDEEKHGMPVTTIDKLSAELGLERVDYIKMDIEGAEQRALLGARETIRKFHPRLSLSTYHRPDDPVKIPQIVRDAWSGYRIECGPCAYADGRIRPDVLYFR